RPFQGPILQVLQAKQLFDADPLPDDPVIPADLSALCLRLLARDPLRRPDPFEIIKKTSSGLEPAAVASPGPGSSHLVGRAPHLAMLEEGYRTLCRQGVPQAIFISGRSGEGKTTLGEHFLGSLRREKSRAV